MSSVVSSVVSSIVSSQVDSFKQLRDPHEALVEGTAPEKDPKQKRLLRAESFAMLEEDIEQHAVRRTNAVNRTTLK